MQYRRTGVSCSFGHTIDLPSRPGGKHLHPILHRKTCTIDCIANTCNLGHACIEQRTASALGVGNIDHPEEEDIGDDAMGTDSSDNTPPMSLGEEMLETLRQCLI